MRNILLISVLSAAVLGACATPSEELRHTGYALATPLRDANIIKNPIPGQLQSLQNPFGTGGYGTCQGLTHEIVTLQRSMENNGNRYVGYRRDGSTRRGQFGNARDVGVATGVTSFIPFYPLFRQLSGAAKRDQRAQAANDRARLRVGYLVGQARAYRCPGF